MVLGLVLLYAFRLFERQLGSGKFAASLACFAGVSTTLQIVSLLIFKGVVSHASPGPYAFIFALFVFFFRDVPKSTRFRVLGLPLSDKTFVYLVGLQMTLASQPHSLLSAVCGLIAGVLYRSLPALRRVRFPTWCRDFCSTRLGPWLESSRRRRRGGYAQVAQQPAGVDLNDNQNPQRLVDHDPAGPQQLLPGAGPAGLGAAPGLVGAHPTEQEQLAAIMQHQRAAMLAQQQQQQQQQRANGTANPAVPVQLDEDKVRSLMSMGFNEHAVRQALTLSQNNLERATNILLDSR
eukprot:TRINITY_DN66404_c3_g1_i3.p1 TRINITY_DN66404_c3_g1~~TRINITY_DN66404_c3_g1_i3.p1  ORF type:complete len:292 (-),score=117.11 TRINITY_DN66404_c3_g1_i3:55-930(-)